MLQKKLLYGILAIVVLAVIGIALFILVSPPTPPIILTEDSYKCNEDADCISVAAECCSCNMGGTNTAINKNYKDYWEKQLSYRCTPSIKCLAVFQCFGEPRCISNKCQLVAKRNQS